MKRSSWGTLLQDGHVRPFLPLLQKIPPFYRKITLSGITLFSFIYFSRLKTQSIGCGEIYGLHVQPRDSNDPEEWYTKKIWEFQYFSQFVGYHSSGSLNLKFIEPQVQLCVVYTINSFCFSLFIAYLNLKNKLHWRKSCLKEWFLCKESGKGPLSPP